MQQFFTRLSKQLRNLKSFSISLKILSQFSNFNALINNNCKMQNQKAEVQNKQIEAQFAQIFQDPFNTVCYECGRKTRHWVDTELAIFLCLNCAGLYKQASDKIIIKCISTDPFTPQELRYIKNGGNRKFKEFLSNYEMQQLIYRERLQTKAVAYYRALLKEEFNGRVPPLAPDAKTGKQKFKTNQDLSEMSAGEVIQQVKSKAVFIGAKVADYGQHAYTAVHHKITSGELKEDVKHIGQSIANKAKGVWQTLASKIQ